MMPQAGNVFFPGAIDRGPWLLWDVNTAAAGATLGAQIQFYTHTSGANGKNITNLVQANRVPPPKAFSVMSLGWAIAPNMLPADVIAIFQNYWFELKIDDKTFVEGLIPHYPSGTGIAGYASTNSATTAVVQTVNNGDPGVYAMRRFNDYPRIIPANVFFGINLNLGGTAPTLVATVASTAVSPAYGGMNLRADLDGLYDRSVQ